MSFMLIRRHAARIFAVLIDGDVPFRIGVPDVGHDHVVGQPERVVVQYVGAACTVQVVGVAPAFVGMVAAIEAELEIAVVVDGLEVGILNRVSRHFVDREPSGVASVFRLLHHQAPHAAPWMCS